MSRRRKRKTHPQDMEQSNRVHKRRNRPRLKLEDAPPVQSIHDLIELGKSLKFYKNLDTVMLWRIAPYLEELDHMIGMESLKETVFFQVIYYLQNMHTRNQNEEYLHTLILGPPGHGKTQISKIIGKIYQAMGILSRSGGFKIAHRDDFVAEYLGQTAIKTKKLLKSCIGGVLFIDEVYSLAPTRSDRDSFAKEALDTLTAFLSEHKNDFCCIAAGYEEDVKNCFFAMNKGLERRFTWVHRIEPYKPVELAKIFMKMIGEIKWDIAFEEKDVASIIDKNKDMFKNAGGDIETFISKCKMMHSRRVFSLGKEHKFVLTKADLEATIEYLKKNYKPKDDKPPWGMYT
jgi:SpoVK/Ycf46/Vps4 family AAA+-type ATPase